MSTALSLSMRLLLDSRQFVQGLTGSLGSVNKFTKGVRGEIDRIRGSFNSLNGRLATLGAGIGVGAVIQQSAQLDKQLIQVGLTAGSSSGEVASLRNEVFRLARETGQPVTDLVTGFNDLIQAGNTWGESLNVIRATNKATAVTNAQVTTLTKGLSVAAAAFQFDLGKPRQALELLDKMVVAGRAGNAELENLSDIFARVGVNAQSAGFSFDKTLAFIEALSMVERQPERLATLADSTLRIFTNQRYMKAAQASTGVRFFENGSRRDPLAVFADLKKRYDKLNSDAARSNFIGRAFQNVDLDTVKGIRTLLTGPALANAADIEKRIGGAAGTLDRDLQAALSNSVDQVGRLKSALRSAADGFSKPLNAAIEGGIKKLLDSKKDGGFELSGKQILGLGAATAVTAYAAQRFLPGALGKLIGRSSNVAQGVAIGKGLEAAGAATPVYVVNMPSGGMSGGDVVGTAAVAAGAAKVLRGWRVGAALLAAAPSLTSIGSFGAAGIAGAAGLVGAAGLAGYGVGSLINRAIDGSMFQDKVGAAIAHSLAFVGNDTARQAIAEREKFQHELNIKIDDKRTTVTTARSDSKNTVMNVERVGTRGYFQ